VHAYSDDFRLKGVSPHSSRLLNFIGMAQHGFEELRRHIRIQQLT